MKVVILNPDGIFDLYFLLQCCVLPIRLPVQMDQRAFPPIGSVTASATVVTALMKTTLSAVTTKDKNLRRMSLCGHTAVLLINTLDSLILT